MSGVNAEESFCDRPGHIVANLRGIDDQDIEPRFECPICLQCLNNPVLTTCGHRFCSDCIHEWLRSKGSCCPIDNSALSLDTDLFPDNFTRREIMALESRDSLSQSRPLLECTHKGVGCTATFTANSQLDEHLETHLQHHLNLLTAAYNKLHFSVEESKMDPKAQEAATLWEPDSKSKTVQTDWHGLVRSLYERIVLLEQQNREQIIQIDHLKLQIATNRSDIKKMSDDAMTVHCNGVYIWTIANFSVKMKAHQLWTPGFHTAPNGYKLCARVNLSQVNQNSFGLHIHLMRSNHDACLVWPFVGQINFTLVNINTCLNRQDTMVTPPELMAFLRPASDINPRGFGYAEYITLQELNAGFLINDCLTIKIKVDPEVRCCH